MTVRDQFFGCSSADKPGRTGDEYTHVKLSLIARFNEPGNGASPIQDTRQVCSQSLEFVFAAHLLINNHTVAIQQRDKYGVIKTAVGLSAVAHPEHASEIAHIIWRSVQ